MRVFGVVLFAVAAAAPAPGYNPDVAKSLASYARAAYCIPDVFKGWNCGKMCEDAPLNPDTVRALKPDSWNILNPSTWFQLTGYIGIQPNQIDNHCVIGFSGSKANNVPNMLASWLYFGRGIQAGVGQWKNDCKDCDVSYGYLKAYEGIQDQLRTYWSELKCKDAIIVGHESGGALATLAAFDLRANYDYKVEAVWTYGKPRVGNQAFVDAFIGAAEKHNAQPPMWRVVHYKDIVPRQPAHSSSFVHEPYEVYYTDENSTAFKVCNSADQLDEDPTCSAAVPESECNKQDSVSYFVDAFPGPIFAFDSAQLPEACIPAADQRGMKSLWPFVLVVILLFVLAGLILKQFCLACCGLGSGKRKISPKSEPLLSSPVTYLSKPAVKSKFLVYVTSTTTIRGGDQISVGDEVVLVESNDGEFLSLQDRLQKDWPKGTEIRKL